MNPVLYPNSEYAIRVSNFLELYNFLKPDDLNSEYRIQSLTTSRVNYFLSAGCPFIKTIFETLGTETTYDKTRLFNGHPYSYENLAIEALCTFLSKKNFEFESIEALDEYMKSNLAQLKAQRQRRIKNRNIVVKAD